jgi:hypothetical protein
MRFEGVLLMTIAALVLAAWVVEDLKLVGGGCLFHLSYNTSQVSSRAMALLSKSPVDKDIPVVIFWRSDANRALRVADGHLAELVRVNTTLRLHIRLLHVQPFIPREEILWPYQDVFLDVM